MKGNAVKKYEPRSLVTPDWRYGQRGPVWWTDGAPDFNRKLARNTPYAAWYASTERSNASGEESHA
jgi:hypothetical protein